MRAAEVSLATSSIRVVDLETAEQLAALFDGGLGMRALHAIAASPPGPLRELEVELWIDEVIRNQASPVVTIAWPGMTDNERRACLALQLALADEPFAEACR